MKMEKKERYSMKIRGDLYNLNDKGEIKRLDVPGFEFSDDWKVYGVASRWNSRPIKWESLKHEMDREACTEGYLYDVDHGTVRFWAGQYEGKLPKVRICKLIDYEERAEE
jgi:hypothetical protein